MKYFRATFRLIALVAVTAGYYLLWLFGRPFVAAFKQNAVNWHGRNFQGWARVTARIINLKIKVRNAPPVPPFLLVANHLSYVDVIVIESQVNCVFIAKSEVAGWPILGPVCRSLGTIFIDRTQKRDIMRTMARVEKSIEKGFGVVLFAEGTSTAGHAVAPFRSSLLELAARRQMPVHYASLTYLVPDPGASAEQSVCWWGDMTFAGHVFRLLQLPRFEAQVVFGKQPVLDADRRVLAQKLWSAVTEVFTPVTSEK